MELEAAPASLTKPLIHKYEDYRLFIADYYNFKKAQRTGFSYRLFAKRCGIRSPNYLQLVIQGKRNLSEAMAEAVAQAMGLTGSEKKYFCALVAKSNAAGPNDEAKAERERLKAIKNLVTQQIPENQREILSHWHHLLVRELVFLPNFEASGEWVALRLRGMLSVAQAEASLNLLQKCGFLVQNQEGKWQAADPVIDTGADGFHEFSILNYHREHLKTWAQHLEKFARDDRELGLINIPIDYKKIPELKSRIRAFQDEIIGWLQDEKNPDAIVQLGTYLIPVTE